ncbi:hypothetical protein BGW39_011769 [Mortierella sp. 14UC]|nr:hypothetical protein BGW39_011769 [Mortierella sp. 14UC]
MVRWERGVSHAHFVEMLSQCLNLEELRIIRVWLYCDKKKKKKNGHHNFSGGVTNERRIDARAISTACPKLHTIEYDRSYWAGNLHDEIWPLGVMEHLPANVFRNLKLSTDGYYPFDEFHVYAAMGRHPTSLETVVIDTAMTSHAIQSILNTCQNLSHLQIGSPIDLEDTSSTIWAASGLRHLSLCVKADLPHSSLPGRRFYRPYYLQLPARAPTVQEKMAFERLDRFYGQIGRQTELKRLDLFLDRGVQEEEPDSDSYSDASDDDDQEVEESEDESEEEVEKHGDKSSLSYADNSEQLAKEKKGLERQGFEKKESKTVVQGGP